MSRAAEIDDAIWAGRPSDEGNFCAFGRARTPVPLRILDLTPHCRGD